MKKQYITYFLVKVSYLRIYFSIGEKVKVIDGPFKVFYVAIDTINEEKQILSITDSYFW